MFIQSGKMCCRNAKFQQTSTNIRFSHQTLDGFLEMFGGWLRWFYGVPLDSWLRTPPGAAAAAAQSSGRPGAGERAEHAEAAGADTDVARCQRYGKCMGGETMGQKHWKKTMGKIMGTCNSMGSIWGNHTKIYREFMGKWMVAIA